jgi:outer membrane protein TolC
MNNRLRVLATAGLIAALLPGGLARAQDAEKVTMRQAVTLALQNSRDLALARVQYTVALNEAGLDRAAFLPNLYTGSGAAYTSGSERQP